MRASCDKHKHLWATIKNHSSILTVLTLLNLPCMAQRLSLVVLGPCKVTVQVCRGNTDIGTLEVALLVRVDEAVEDVICCRWVHFHPDQQRPDWHLNLQGVRQSHSSRSANLTIFLGSLPVAVKTRMDRQTSG